MGRYTGMQEGSLHFGRDDNTEIAIYKHITAGFPLFRYLT